MQKKDILLIVVTLVITAITGFATYSGFNSVLLFSLAAVSLVLVAMIVVKATEELGSRMGPAGTGVLQSALGNLPELFVCIFALRAGLDTVLSSFLMEKVSGWKD